MRILIIEDDKDLCAALKICLQQNEYVVDCVHTGEDGLFYCMENAYDLVILDRMLPKPDGITILKQMRQKHLSTPVLLLTALDGIQDRVTGLDAGADDYLTKPFATEELLARIRALSRRPNTVEHPTEYMTCGDLRLDQTALTLFGPKGCCQLSKKETDFFVLLFRSVGQTLSRDVLISRIWGVYASIEDGNLDNYIYFLRRRLTTVGSSVRIVTVRGVGYRLEVSP